MNDITFYVIGGLLVLGICFGIAWLLEGPGAWRRTEKKFWNSSQSDEIRWAMDFGDKLAKKERQAREESDAKESEDRELRRREIAALEQIAKTGGEFKP